MVTFDFARSLSNYKQSLEIGPLSWRVMDRARIVLISRVGYEQVAGTLFHIYQLEPANIITSNRQHSTGCLL